ncbi:MAG: (Fe-S)-binding protein [Myxococcota bacterium]
MPEAGTRPAAAGLIDYEATLDCVHCGLCLPSCPTYQETGREASSPRGRIYLMRGVAEQRVPLEGLVSDEMYLCLGCRACESACPAGVRYGHLLEGIRAEIDERSARSRVRRFFERFALRYVVASRRGLRTLAAGLRLYQKCGLQSLVRRSRALRLVPALARADSMLPQLPGPYRPPVLVPARGRRRGRVAFFSGCIMSELFGPVNEASVKVLARNGYEVAIPQEQGCCGALHLHCGDARAAEKLRERNRRAFANIEVDAIVTNSAGCGAALRDAGDALSGAVRDIAEFLVEVDFEAPRGRLERRVAYDDPCHLLHGQRIADAPRALLRAIPGVDLVDLPGHRDCCGAAGIYNLTHPEMAARLQSRKIEALRRTRPDVLATGNPGCLIQIGAGVRGAGLPVEVLHPVELLARSYAGEGQPKADAQLVDNDPHL